MTKVSLSVVLQAATHWNEFHYYRSLNDKPPPDFWQHAIGCPPQSSIMANGDYWYIMPPEAARRAHILSGPHWYALLKARAINEAASNDV